jgi:aspartate aminotransferase
MSVARTVSAQLERASWIRRMFEEGNRLRAERGPENVFDFTLGNPDIEPPAELIEALRRVVEENRPGSHGYMPNAGFPDVRSRIAARLSGATGLAYTPEHVLMTVGSAGAINTFLKAILDPGDEVIVLAPYFPEYRFYIGNHAGRMVVVETDEEFLPESDRIRAAITPRTRAILLNSPNNPTGRLYRAEALAGIDAVLEQYGEQVTAISDEPYRSIVFDGLETPEMASVIRRTVTAYSWSKSLAIAGERIGYLAISPRMPDAAALWNACTFTNRVLGYVNAPAIWQRVVAEAGHAAAESAGYARKRDLLADGLAKIGYQLLRPEGAFYLFPKTPVPDDVAFVGMLAREGVLAVPGSGFGRGGYIRLSLTVPEDVIRRALPAFERAYRAAGV